VRDPVTLLLRLEDVSREAAVLGPALEHVPQELRAAHSVLPRLREEIEEDAILRD
jgi:hypothetical protein